ncbi:class I SAM-dependent methyltransferase [Priestia megaterium]
MKVIVTTAGRTNEQMIVKAKQVAADLSIPFVTREKKSVADLQNLQAADVLVVGKNRVELHVQNEEEPIFFHPNSAMFRVKRWLRGERDPFIEAASLKKGMSVLDCTLGLASDSMMASAAVGKSGKVVGLEGNRYVAYLVKQGLLNWESDVQELNDAMKRINVVHQNFESFLACCKDNSFDVVYFDPMFQEQIEESNGINGIKAIALYTTLTPMAIQEAKRVAKQKVVLKDHWKSSRFEEHGFTVQKRKTSKFHYGTIDIQK